MSSALGRWSAQEDHGYQEEEEACPEHFFADLGRHGEDQLAPVDEVSLAKLVVASIVVPWNCWKRL